MVSNIAKSDLDSVAKQVTFKVGVEVFNSIQIVVIQWIYRNNVNEIQLRC